MRFILVVLIASAQTCNAFRTFQVNGAETLLALEGEQLDIKCKADIAMGYCGFIHPSGKRYSVSGASLEAGQCSIKVNASTEVNGPWRCHIGRKDAIGLEIMQIINVRVVTQLAALQKNITVVHGKPVTLQCATVTGLTPLRYCRFEPPSGRPFSINSDVTADKPILKRYYFPSNKSLDRGDCAVTIRQVKYEDVGEWGCGAGLDGQEHLDTILLQVEGLYTMSTASATGIAFGALGIAAFLFILGFVVWKKRRLLGSAPGDADHEMQPRPGCSRGSPAPSLRQGYHYGSHQELRSHHGSRHELASQPGSVHEPRSRQGSMHTPIAHHSEELIRRIPLHGSPSPASQRLLKEVPRIEVQSPSPRNEPSAPQFID